MKMFKVLALMILVALSTGCTLSSVDAGEEGVMTYQPMFFGKGGVDNDPIVAGAIWTVFSTKVDRYNIKPIKYKERFIDLTASDNVAIDFDLYITLQIQGGKTPMLHELSGEQWYDNKITDTLRAFTRNEARTKTSIELRTNEKIIVETQNEIKRLMIEYIKDIKLPVNVVKVNIGKVVPPAEVLAEAAQTAAQKQRKQTQEQREAAEASRETAETAAAKADKAYANEFNMTTDQFLKNKELEVMLKAIEKGSKVSLIMNASSAQPIFNAH